MTTLPSAEPGDLLVKTALAQVWIFTVQGWRELAPAERPASWFGRRYVDTSFDRPPGEPADFVFGAKVAPPPTDDRAVEAQATPPLIRAAHELRLLAGAIRRTIEVAEQPDLGVDARLTAFAEGIEAARRIVLEVPE